MSEVKDDGDKALLSTAEWVRRSRKIELTEKEKAALALKRLEEEEEENLRNLQAAAKQSYRDSDLKGLKVMHSETDFIEGEQIILTLADSSVIEKDEKGRVLGISNADDILENVNLADEARRQEREKVRKRARQPVYTGYDDAEFEDGAIPGKRPNILSHYDEVKKTGPQLVIGMQHEANESKLETNIDSDVKSSQPESLKVEKNISSDFYTPSEFSAFIKPKKEKKKRKLRTRVDDALDNENMNADANDEMSSLSHIIEDMNDHSTSDRGSRKDRPTTSSAAAELENRIQKRERYEEAIRSAEDKKNVVTPVPTVATGSVKVSTASVAPSTAITRPRPPPASEPVEDDDAEIAQALARARRIALQKERQQRLLEEQDAGLGESKDAQDSEDIGAERVRALLMKASSVSNGSTSSSTAMDVDGGRPRSHSVSLLGEVDAEGRKTDGTLIFTDTTEFTARLQARLNEKVRQKAEAAVREQELERLDGVDVAEWGDRPRGKPRSDVNTSGWREVVDFMDIDGPKRRSLQREAALGKGKEAESKNHASGEGEGEGDEDEEGAGAGGDEMEDDQLAFVHKQPLVASGMAATLALLKGTGELGKKDDLAGRANDDHEDDPSSAVSGVKLEYRDEYGRKLTKKEAFRQLSYRFHGHGPSKKKEEKRLKVINLLFS